MRVLAVLALAVLPVAAAAQDDDDRGWLTGKIEGLLSDAGREVRLEGFAGALSSRATFTELSIADDAGVWLTIRDGAIQWNRSALLRGAIEIEEMSAASIDLPRLPEGEEAAPSPEATPFALPDLPVSIDIGRIAAERVTLGQPVIGTALDLTAEGGFDLAGGSGAAKLSVTRQDAGPAAQLRLDAGYTAETRRLRLDLLVEEEAGGIAAGLLGLPGDPSLTLAVSGVGPVDDVTTDIVLSTDGQRRLAGAVRLFAEEGAQGFDAALSGDITPLLSPDFHGFFGAEAGIEARGRREASGRLDLSRLSVASAGLAIDGTAALAPGGLPERFDLRIDAGGGEAPLRLPVPGAAVALDRGQLSLAYDAKADEGWSLSADIAGLDHPDLAVGRLTASGSGRIAAGDRPVAGGTIRLSAQALDWADPALAEALGPALDAETMFHWRKGDPLSLPRLRLAAGDLGLSGRATLTAEGTQALTVAGRVQAEAGDLSRFSGLAGRSLAGALEGEVAGRYDLLSGAGEVDARLIGTDVAPGDPRLDRALAGRSEIMLSAARDTAGLDLRSLSVSAGPLALEAGGRIATGDTAVSARLALSDLGRIDPAWSGAARASADWRQEGGAARLTAEGTMDGFAMGIAEVDTILAGESRFSAVVSGPADALWVERVLLDAPGLDLTMTGAGETGARRLSAEAELADLGQLVPEFPGPVRLSGTARETAGGVTLDLSGTGPGGTEARVAGDVATDPLALSLAVDGTTNAALADPFLDPQSVSGPIAFALRLDGPPDLSALSGEVRFTEGRLAAPAANLVLEGIRATLGLGDGRLRLDATAAAAEGGRIEAGGTLGLDAGLPADLAITLDGFTLFEPDLLRAQVDGRLTVTGPVATGARIAGALTLPGAEIRVPETLPGSAGLLPGLDHRGEPATVRQTRARAGLLKQEETTGAGPAHSLDVTVSAPRRIFVRGRGLEAELGGQVALGGTVQDVAATGRFDLIRGRLDLLGKRFSLDEGLIGLQGALDPFLRFVATAPAGDATATVRLEGPASAPEVSFTSSPPLPEEEIVAQLLFGRDLTSLSPLQAAQLAGAVASLAGVGGEGIVGRIRQGFGLDDLDIATGADGGTELRLGKYISDNLYTDVTIGSDGKSRINLNLDVRPGVTLRGSVGSEGETGVGVFYQRDY